MNNLSIKNRLIALTVLILIGLSALVMLNKYADSITMHSIEVVSHAADGEKSAQKTYAAELRFYRTPNVSTVADVKDEMDNAAGYFEHLQKEAPEYSEEISALMSDIQAHQSLFRELQSAVEEMGYSEDSGLRGMLRSSIHDIEEEVNGKQDDAILASLLMLRRHEKDFIIRRDRKYYDKFQNAIAVMNTKIDESQDLSMQESSRIKQNLAKYQSVFNQYVESAIRIKDLEDKIAGSVNEIDARAVNIAHTAEKDGAEAIAKTDLVILVFEIIIGLGLLLFCFILMRSIARPLTVLQQYSQQVASNNFADVSAESFPLELLELHDDIAMMVLNLKHELGFAQGVLNGIHTPCAIVNSDFTMEWCNPQMVDLLGREGSTEQFKGLRSGEFFWHDPSRETLSDKAITQGKMLHGEFEFTNVKGVDFHIDVVTTPFYDLDGNLLGSVSFWNDITVIRSGEITMRQKNENIEQAAVSANKVADQVGFAADGLTSQVGESTTRAAQQKERTTEVATAVEQMNATVMDVASNASNAAELANRAKDEAREGSRIVNDVLSTIKDVSGRATVLSKDMATLGSQADGIGSIMNVISDIADQTNLLALNAAIEAARAGDAGRGFAVVADEVRKLAEKTMSATDEVSSYINAIQESTRNNILATEETSSAVDHASTMATNAGEALTRIVDIVDQSADQSRSIAAAAEEQSAAAEQIARSTEDINTSAGQNEADMDEAAQAVEKLTKLAGDLRTVMAEMQS